MAKTNPSIVPNSLKHGDKVAIIATARYVDSAALEFAEQVFKSWGLNPTRGENLLQQENNFAGSDQQRRADLQRAFDDPTIKAIFCFRGGYGSVRIVDELENTILKKA